MLPTTLFSFSVTTFLSETNEVMSTMILNISGKVEHLLLQNTVVRQSAKKWPAFVL